jgi:hypothetical protein
MNGLQANRPIGPRGRHGGGCGCGRCATAAPRMIERLALESLSAALAHAQQGHFEADLGMEAATPAGPLTLPGEFSGWRPPTPVMEVLFRSPPAEFTHRPKEKDPRDRRFLYRLYRRGGEKALYIGMAYNTRVQDRVWSHLKGLVTQSQCMAKTPTVMNLRNMSLQAIKDSKSEIGKFRTMVSKMDIKDLMVQVGEIRVQPRTWHDPKLMHAYEMALQVKERPHSFVRSSRTFERDEP